MESHLDASNSLVSQNTQRSKHTPGSNIPSACNSKFYQSSKTLSKSKKESVEQEVVEETLPTTAEMKDEPMLEKQSGLATKFTKSGSLEEDRIDGSLKPKPSRRSAVPPGYRAPVTRAADKAAFAREKEMLSKDLADYLIKRKKTEALQAEELARHNISSIADYKHLILEALERNRKRDRPRCALLLNALSETEAFDAKYLDWDSNDEFWSGHDIESERWYRMLCLVKEEWESRKKELIKIEEGGVGEKVDSGKLGINSDSGEKAQLEEMVGTVASNLQEAEQHQC